MWSTRHHEYKFADVTRFNIQQYVDLLNLYFSSPGLEFHSLMMDRRDLRAGLHKWGNDEWGAYVSICRRLLDASLSRDIFAIVDLQGKPHKSDVVLEDVLCSVDRVKGCLRATSDMSIFLQIVDLLLGCVQFDFKDRLEYYDAASRRAKEKRQLVNFVKSRLGIGSNMPLLSSSQSFMQWDTPIPLYCEARGVVRNREGECGYDRRPSRLRDDVLRALRTYSNIVSRGVEFFQYISALATRQPRRLIYAHC